MSAVLAAAIVLAPQNSPGVKYWTLDDFTVGAYTVVLTGGGTDNHGFSGLDKRHCVFGQRRTYVDINSNPNHTTLTLSVGDHEQRFDSPKQVAWEYLLQYGYDGLFVLDFTNVVRFNFDLNNIPDTMSMFVEDTSFRSAGNGGWLLFPGGVYFNRASFSGDVDWARIRFVQIKQDFNRFPNPLLYSVTKFYVSLNPAPRSPGSG